MHNPYSCSPMEVITEQGPTTASLSYPLPEPTLTSFLSSATPPDSGMSFHLRLFKAPMLNYLRDCLFI